MEHLIGQCAALNHTIDLVDIGRRGRIWLAFATRPTTATASTPVTGLSWLTSLTLQTRTGRQIGPVDIRRCRLVTADRVGSNHRYRRRFTIAIVVLGWRDDPGGDFTIHWGHGLAVATTASAAAVAAPGALALALCIAAFELVSAWHDSAVGREVVGFDRCAFVYRIGSTRLTLTTRDSARLGALRAVASGVTGNITADFVAHSVA